MVHEKGWLVPDDRRSMTADTTTYLLRVWLPDRPGALGLVASRIGAVGADIVAVDIVERDGGQAVDDLVIQLPASRVELLTREIRAVDGVDVEELHEITSGAPDLGLGVLAAATDLVRAEPGEALASCLCVHARRVVRLDWAALCDGTSGAVLAADGGPPPPSWLVAYARGVARESGTHEAGPVQVGNDPHLARAHLGLSSLVLLAGRQALSIRPRERALLDALVGVAGARGPVDFESGATG
jgi:hypothetical protein